jgi:hypothetical protein
MTGINVSDRVRIAKVNTAAEQHLLNRVGVVVMIADGTRCVVAFPDGSGATVEVSQLAKMN